MDGRGLELERAIKLPTTHGTGGGGEGGLYCFRKWRFLGRCRGALHMHTHVHHGVMYVGHTQRNFGRRSASGAQSTTPRRLSACAGNLDDPFASGVGYTQLRCIR
jgi:hypothetical protein